jgi:hypothetical protein
MRMREVLIQSLAWVIFVVKCFVLQGVLALLALCPVGSAVFFSGFSGVHA